MKSRLSSILLAALVMAGSSVMVSQHRVDAETEFSAETITLEAAARGIEAALAKSEELGVTMNITVLDVGANLKAFVRMDDAMLGSLDISMKKAKTAVLFNGPSSGLGAISQPGGVVYGIEESNGGLVTFGGGFPLHNADGKLIGSIGVSGSSVANDEIVAKAGVDAL